MKYKEIKLSKQRRKKAALINILTDILFHYPRALHFKDENL